MRHPRSSHEPIDRLTRIANDVLEGIDTHPEATPADRAIVLLDDGHRGGIALHGYDDTVDAATDLLLHLKAIFEANGQTVSIIPLDQRGQG